MGVRNKGRLGLRQIWEGLQCLGLYTSTIPFVMGPQGLLVKLESSVLDKFCSDIKTCQLSISQCEGRLVH